ncbi:phage portal protein [Devosia sp. MC532]|uniref:phage portal protein n=1 Tax=Devosia sp. MC532 TaxID=2799788 RepID=UPI0018F538EC|nr:phage portal protein [Devosia sp. MC532]MBJ7578138.1 phage portal protein [Devosia sp. MC532]
MQVPAVSCAVELIADAVGTLPVKLFVRNAEGKEVDPAHLAFRLAHDEANEWTSAAELRTQLTRDALLNDSGGFAIANRTSEGRVVEFIRIEPAAVEIRSDEATGEPFYMVNQGRKSVRYDYHDVLHIRAFGDTAPVTRARNAISVAADLERHAAQLFANSARPSGILKTGQKNATAIENIKASWNAAFGRGNSGGTAVVPADTEYTPITMTSVDAQFAEMRRFQTEEIARAFRVPPTMLFDLTRGTWANTEEMGQQFLTYTLRPWLRAWEWAYARVLLSPEERTERFFEFITDDLLTVSFASRAASYGQYRSMGVLTANEVRAGLNLPPLPGGDVLQNPYTTSASQEPSVKLPTEIQKDAA